ncbi:MAG: hypothetical protein KKH80_03730, partial [Candidatus Omnitrophica bacterium]|nr:hypothetical protein [Candidatus Omnitrophota bacterium]
LYSNGCIDILDPEGKVIRIRSFADFLTYRDILQELMVISRLRQILDNPRWNDLYDKYLRSHFFTLKNNLANEINGDIILTTYQNIKAAFQRILEALPMPDSRLNSQLKRIQRLIRKRNLEVVFHKKRESIDILNGNSRQGMNIAALQDIARQADVTSELFLDGSSGNKILLILGRSRKEKIFSELDFESFVILIISTILDRKTKNWTSAGLLSRQINNDSVRSIVNHVLGIDNPRAKYESNPNRPQEPDEGGFREDFGPGLGTRRIARYSDGQKARERLEKKKQEDLLITDTVTERGRLKDVDKVILGMLPSDAKVVVDFGIGYPPYTTLELAKRVSRTHPKAKVIGVDVLIPDSVLKLEDGKEALFIEGEIIGIYEPLYRNVFPLSNYRKDFLEMIQARHYEFSLRTDTFLIINPYQEYTLKYNNLSFLKSNFVLNLPYEVNLIRIFNVLRYYSGEDRMQALRELSLSLKKGGIIIEGNYGLQEDASNRLDTYIIYRKINGELQPQSFNLFIDSESIHHNCAQLYLAQQMEPELIKDLEALLGGMRAELFSLRQSFGYKGMLLLVAKELNKLGYIVSLNESGHISLEYQEEAIGQSKFRILTTDLTKLLNDPDMYARSRAMYDLLRSREYTDRQKILLILKLMLRETDDSLRARTRMALVELYKEITERQDNGKPEIVEFLKGLTRTLTEPELEALLDVLGRISLKGNG